jgi:hypothetical protein
MRNSHRDMNIRRMTRDELDTLVEWAACEGWNPGLNDAEMFWATDPDGFVAAEIEGELIGGGSIVAYEKKYGFIASRQRGQRCPNEFLHSRARWFHPINSLESASDVVDRHACGKVWG